MNYSKNTIVILFLLMSIDAFTQSQMTKSDSIFLMEKTVFVPSISKATLGYTKPVAPQGFSLQLRGSDNLSVINKSGAVFTPLNDMTVNLLQ